MRWPFHVWPHTTAANGDGDHFLGYDVQLLRASILLNLEQELAMPRPATPWPWGIWMDCSHCATIVNKGRGSIPACDEYKPPQYIRPKLSIKTNVVVTALTHTKQCYYSSKEWMAMANYLCSMVQATNQGFQFSFDAGFLCCHEPNIVSNLRRQSSPLIVSILIPSRVSLVVGTSVSGAHGTPKLWQTFFKVTR